MKYKVECTEAFFVFEEIEADTEEEAHEKAYNIMRENFEENINWDVKEIENELV